jgi:DNA-binding FadR family transcriptional regulator
MRERVRALRGDFSVTSEHGKGTRVRAEIFRRSELGVRLVAALTRLPSAYWGRLQRLLRDGRQESS